MHVLIYQISYSNENHDTLLHIIYYFASIASKIFSGGSYHITCDTRCYQNFPGIFRRITNKLKTLGGKCSEKIQGPSCSNMYCVSCEICVKLKQRVRIKFFVKLKGSASESLR